jgi:hypothetical protein
MPVGSACRDRYGTAVILSLARITFVDPMLEDQEDSGVGSRVGE